MPFAFADIPALDGRTAIVTGGDTGIGLCIARELAAHGARVLLACRDEGAALAARARIARIEPRADTAFLPLDLADPDSIRAAADQAIRREKRIDLLVNNAGVTMPPLTRAADDIELQFAVNHLGHFVLTALLLDTLAQGDDPRVVCRSSLVHRRGRIDFDNLDAARGYDRRAFYEQSRLANLLFALELDRRLRAASSPIAALACHPGLARSELTGYLGMFGNKANPLIGLTLNDSRAGALPALQAATDPRAGGGDYYGPYGLMELRGHKSGRAVVSDTARDPLLAARLWECSIELTGIDPGLAGASA